MNHLYLKRGIPIAFCISAQKDGAIYAEFLQLISDLSGGFWKPYGCMVDFELAIWDGVYKVFPDAMIYACLFHFKQTVSRWMTSINFIYYNKF